MWRWKLTKTNPLAKTVKVSPPPITSPVTDSRGMPTRSFVDFIYRLWERTGGNTDKTEMTRGQAANAQATATDSVQKAEAAQEAASSGIEKADNAAGVANQAFDLADHVFGIAVNGQVPIGGVMPIIGGSEIPENWALCDGSTEGVPDLRDLFIVGAGATFAPGDTGGAVEWSGETEDSSEMQTGSSETEISINESTVGVAEGEDIQAITEFEVSDPGHEHEQTAHKHSVTVPTVPPYYAMALIARVY